MDRERVAVLHQFAAEHARVAVLVAAHAVKVPREEEREVEVRAAGRADRRDGRVGVRDVADATLLVPHVFDQELRDATLRRAAPAGSELVLAREREREREVVVRAKRGEAQDERLVRIVVGERRQLREPIVARDPRDDTEQQQPHGSALCLGRRAGAREV